jgi:hypothetical protein
MSTLMWTLLILSLPLAFFIAVILVAWLGYYER